jgi:hypothetical protein
MSAGGAMPTVRPAHTNVVSSRRALRRSKKKLRVLRELRVRKNRSPFPVPQIFVIFRVGAPRRFVSAAGDDTHKGESEMVAPLRRSLKVCADSDGSIAF